MTTTQPAAELPPLIPRDVLFGNPERVGPQLSPDGRRLAYLAPQDGVMNVWVRTIGQTDERCVTRERTRPIRSFVWAENARQILYPQDQNGDENFHVFRVDLEEDAAGGAGEATDLTPFDGARASIVAVEPEFPDTVLLSVNDRDPTVFDVHRCDLATGALERIAENPGNIVGWVADHNLRVRAAVATQPDGSSEVLVRDEGDNEDNNAGWHTLLAIPFGEHAAPIGFTAANRSLYLLSDREVNTQRLYTLDLDTGTQTLLHAREDVDLSGVLMHPTRHTVQAVAYNRSRQEWVALDPEIAPDLDVLGLVAGGDLAILSRDNADRTWLVAFLRDNGPTAYYAYDRADKNAAFLFTNRPDLDHWTLAPMQPVDIPARDGLTLPCYLTLPPNAEKQNLPLVLDVHGGPWARDVWGFSPDAQWLANRGYAVLQVNYRGSRGFGKAFLNAGNKEWAARMHDDLVDAVRWAIEKQIADPARVAIYGGSYGGYAALVGLTFTPELFACAVDVVGPSNLITLLNSIPPYWAPLKAEFVQRVGDPETEADLLKARSPLFFADRIVRPLLIAQGAHDPRVKQAESDQIVQAARDNGKDVLYLLFEDEGHGFARPENRIKFCAAAEKFLAEHLGGRFEPAHPGEEPPLVG